MSMPQKFYRLILRIIPSFGASMQTRLVVIFLLVKIIPLVLLAILAWHQCIVLGETLRDIAVTDATTSLNNSVVKNIERMTTDTARQVVAFLYDRDADIRYLASIKPDENTYRAFLETRQGKLVKQGKWELAPDGLSWIDTEKHPLQKLAVSTNSENDDMDGFHSFVSEMFEYADAPIYDEITFVDINGQELIKVVAEDSPKQRFPLDTEKKDVSKRENTYVKAETYFSAVKNMKPGDIFVSDVIGAYVGSNYIGMYTPGILAEASKVRGYDIPYLPEEQAYAGRENPNGKRFEGIVRWATPVAGPDGAVIGYVTMALNHDHLMEFVDHLTPMDERYVELPSAYESNYAFIWDYQCRNICHPRHHSIVGFNPETGEPEIPWLEDSIYEGWRKSGVEKWTDCVKDYPTFFEQSRNKRPAPALTRAGLVGLDGRYLNNAPQCTGWMDLTKDGSSGSFYILWSGLYKLNTAAAIPYYTGQYAPSAENGYSRRGFGFVAIGSGLDYFTMPAKDTEAKLVNSADENMSQTFTRLIATTLILTVIVIFIAIWMAWGISHPIKQMAKDMARLATGDVVTNEISYKYHQRYDEIGLLARSLHDLVLSRQDELDMANSIAKGDYTRSIALRSEADLLGTALNTMASINKDALTQVSNAIKQVELGAGAISDVSVSVSQGVQTSEEVLREIAENIDTVGKQAEENSIHAQGANELAVASRNAAQRGYGSVTELASAMSQIRQAGQKIASVAKLIDDIAFQTNLLALNASVEAARAGRQGRGFAVVAEEVRNLSSRSAKAAHETAEMVVSMLKLMETGATLAENSDKEFQEIVNTTTQVVHLFENIVDASNKQSSAMAHIVHSLSQIENVTQENFVNSEQMATSASVLSRQAEELHQMISHFRIGSETEQKPDEAALRKFRRLR